MEIKIWEVSYSREDLESELRKQISDGEWNILIDELTCFQSRQYVFR